MFRCNLAQMLLNQPVIVKSAEHEKNLAWEAAEQAKQNQKAANNVLGAAGGMVGASTTNASGPCRLYVSNLNKEIDDADLRVSMLGSREPSLWSCITIVIIHDVPNTGMVAGVLTSLLHCCPMVTSHMAK